MGFQLGVPLIKYLQLFYVSLSVIMDGMNLLGIIDGDTKWELELLSFGVRSWCTQGVCSNASMKFFGFLIWFLVEQFAY